MIISIVSGKGGVGKTTFAANVATALCAKGKRVILADLNLGCRNLDLLCGIDVVYDLDDVYADVCSLDRAIMSKRYGYELSFVFCSNDENAQYTPQFLTNLIQGLHYYDYVILDCPTGFDNWTREALSISDLCVIITTVDNLATRNSDAFLVRACDVNNNIVCAYNMINIRAEKKKIKDKLASISNIISVPILGIIPYDPAVAKSLHDGEPLTAGAKPEHGARAAFFNIAKRIDGDKIPLLSNGASRVRQ